jgi:5-amino-6-(5-phosphoribosylamino)uracil reductase
MVTLVLAMTADGKISDASKSQPKFGSAEDFAHLERQVALADAIIVGAGTLRDGGSAMRVMDEALIAARKERGQPPQPAQIICSLQGEFEPDLPFFKQPIPRWLLTTDRGAAKWLDTGKFDRILIAETATGKIDWDSAFEQLSALNMDRIACLGGGELAATLLEIDRIDDIWLTVCPIIYGGYTSPSPVTGAGFSPALAPRLELLTVDRVEQEIFLHYRVIKSSVGS